MKLKTDLIEDYRWNKHWTRTKMAEYLGVSPKAYSHIICKGVKSISKIDHIAQKININPKDLLE